MKLGTRALPSHASSVQTAASTECFWPDGQGCKSSFRIGPAFALKRATRSHQEINGIRRATPFELLALLLLALPLLLTLQKLVVLFALGERSHQLLADRATMQDLTQLFGKIFISGAI